MSEDPARLDPLVFYPWVWRPPCTPALILSDTGQPRLGRFGGNAFRSGVQHGWANLLFVRCEIPARCIQYQADCPSQCGLQPLF
jgi:hypothetical protein